MFTGVVEELGEVSALTQQGDSAVLTIRTAHVGTDARHGSSISVNGVCLTVVGARTDDTGSAAGTDQLGANAQLIDFDVMAETLKRSVVGELRSGDRVNLERAVRVDGRLDGHVVQGHVDGTGVIMSRTPGDGWESVRFGLPSNLARYVAEKGSIAVDGVSLTVTAIGTDDGADSDAAQHSDWFEVGLIPETLRATTLGSKRIGASVNLETDVLAKYTERLLRSGPVVQPDKQSEQ